MRLGAGSALLYDKNYTLDIIKTLSKELKLPFSIKTRAGLNETDKEAQKEFLIKASEYCWLISIHGRTFKQEHHGEADLDFVLDVKKKANPNCKIVFN
jgi:tRNA-dihydrouridine synthase